ncbi:hypothetical protein ACFOY8_14880 [Thalassospira xianhensis]|uniref:Uncharacterized protein n=1 Tax=Thalassospira xianhensis MCCC 1A02616 TaxID=1177929 RepID=A0A367UHS6_9PROT|nr:hypothetical protein [Thalassospira xianhensis]RCK07570.1 hypothetical protein TH5_00345 [Thalassospira xianhensis MCCC 1A02616]
MEDREIALKLVLDAMDEDSSIVTVNQLLRIQKAIYMAQVFGVPLGYGFRWHTKEPYSPSLTQDCYDLNAALGAGYDEVCKYHLNASLDGCLSRIRECLQVPYNVKRDDWYDTICSLHYLIEASGKSSDEAVTFIREVRPHLSDMIDAAHARLSQFNLLH